MGEYTNKIYLSNRMQEYQDYIMNHRKNVLDAFYKYFCVVPLNVSPEVLFENCNNHDLSKYSKEEFLAYRLHFYPTPEEDPSNPINELAFEKAWEHHYLVNPHHPEHWLGTTQKKRNPNYDEHKNVKMPNIYIVEMVFDWIAMGKTHNDTAYDYYEANKNSIDKKLIHGEVIEKVHQILDAIKEKDAREGVIN